jgi:hypothetical protein
MNAWEPIAEDSPAGLGVRATSFDLRRAAPDDAAPPTPLVFASPHSGRFYPDDMMAATALDPQAIRRSEDALVDDLIGQAPDLGAALIAARCARAYIDLNREAFELDPGMFADELPEFARARTARVAAGLGRHRPRGLRRPGDLRPQAHLRRGPGADRVGAQALSRGPGADDRRGAPRPRLRDPHRLALHAGLRRPGPADAASPATWCWAIGSGPPAPGS